MTIEIHAPEARVKEWVISYVKEQLTELHHRDPGISRAEVYFREDNRSKQMSCEIDMSVFGRSLTVRRGSDSFETATLHALDVLKENVDEQIRRLNEPPDEVTSTVDI